MIISFSDRAVICGRALKRLQNHFEVRPSGRHCRQLLHHLFRGACIDPRLYEQLVFVALNNIGSKFSFLCKEELKIYIQNRRDALKKNPSCPLPLP